MGASLGIALALGLLDRGIYPELSARVELAVRSDVELRHTWVRIDRAHRILTLYAEDDPLKIYPLGEDDGALRPEDRDELARFTDARTPRLLGVPTLAEDRDGDGIVDRLDILLGAKKLLLNRARYLERYVRLDYPGGDVPRSEGVCTDTVIRALRNAGIDLQKEVHEDLLAAPRAYPMVQKVDASINHRRVRTLVRWFERHWRALPAATPFQPGDIVFFDTFVERPGPDHLGVVGDRPGPNGQLLVINNWTDGAVDAEMDLLGTIPVTHHFRPVAPLAVPR